MLDVRRLFADVVLVVVALAAALMVDPAATAGPLGLVDRNDRPTVVMIQGGVHVRPGWPVDDVWVARGTVRIDGRVHGDVVVGTGSVVVSGRVEGDVTVLRGRVAVRDGGRIDGGLWTPDQPVLEPTAEIGQPPAVPSLTDLPPVLSFLAWGALALVALGGVVAVAPAMRSEALGMAKVGRPGTALAVGSALGGVLALAGLVTVRSPLVLLVGFVATVIVVARCSGRGLGRSWLLTSALSLLGVAISPVLAAAVLATAAALALGALVLVADDLREERSPAAGHHEP